MLSSRTIFMPSATDEDDDDAPKPQHRRPIAIIAVAVTLLVTFSVGLGLKSWASRRGRTAQERTGRTAAPLTPAADLSRGAEPGASAQRGP
jgi:hypothetical protein